METRTIRRREERLLASRRVTGGGGSSLNESLNGASLFFFVRQVSED